MRVRFSLVRKGNSKSKRTRTDRSRWKKIPGWCRAELLRLSNDAGLLPRYSIRFSSRIGFVRREPNRSAVRAGAAGVFCQQVL